MSEKNQIIADNEAKATDLAGQIRTELGKRLDLIDESMYRFCWIVDFPMYELDDNGMQVLILAIVSVITRSALDALRYHCRKITKNS